MGFKTVFGPGTGGPSEFYRISSMITTKNGVVVACADARFCSGADNPNRIDKVVRKSLDSGETWGEYITAVEEQGTKKNKSSAAIDPIMTYVSEIGRIYLHYCHTPAGIGIRNCQCCVSHLLSKLKILTSPMLFCSTPPIKRKESAEQSDFPKMTAKPSPTAVFLSRTTLFTVHLLYCLTAYRCSF